MRMWTYNAFIAFKQEKRSLFAFRNFWCIIGMLTGCLGIILASALLCSVSAAPEKIVIYFYSAETNINNFKSLKMEFDNYLSGFGDYEFQPFSDRKTFEAHVKDKPRSLLLLSSWHYTNIYREYMLSPVLVGLRNGQRSQKRILVAPENAADPNVVKTSQIASASSVPHTINILSSMFQEDEAAAAFKILSVPKDIDALMSVGFGMAQSAVITESSFESLKTINPSLHKKLTIVAESEETLLLIVAAPEDFVPEAQELISIIENMADDPDGEKRMRMLGLDGWQPLGPSDRSKLEG
jgi:hypothetical protein